MFKQKADAPSFLRQLQVQMGRAKMLGASNITAAQLEVAR